MDIDFVLAWVDGGDPEWIRSRNQYSDKPENLNEARFRDWDVLKYWFRAVEKYAPWVRKIHFVTCGQTPSWLNTNHEKLNLVNHRDYIPEEYLPTFSPRTIELNFHRIPDLAEHFVYFNDDMYVNDHVVPEDFFRNGLPCDSAVLWMYVPSMLQDDFRHLICNDVTFVNDHFNKHQVIKRNPFKWFNFKYGKFLLKNIYSFFPKGFSFFQNFHIPSSMLKSTYEKVWEMEPELLHNTCMNKFRGLGDVNQYVMSYYNLCTGSFIPRRTDFGQYYMIGENSERLHQDIMSHRHKVICANDNICGVDFEEEKRKLTEAFERVLPEKSAFEK